MIKKILLALTLLAASAIVAPVLAQPDLPAPKAASRPEKRTIGHRPLFLSPDGRLVAMIQSDMSMTGHHTQHNPDGAQVSLWEVATGRLIWRKHSPANYYPNGSFSPDGSRFLCHGSYRRLENNVYVDRKNYVHVWDTTSGESMVSLELKETDDLQELVFSPDGQQLAGKIFDFGKQETTDFDARLIGKVWDAKTGKLLRDFRDRPQLTRHGRWETQGNYLLTSDNTTRYGVKNKQTLALWSWPDLELVNAVEVDDEIVLHKALSPDGKRVAFTFNSSTIGSGTIHLWDVKSKEYSIMGEAQVGSHLNINSLVFMADGKNLVGSGGTLQGIGSMAFLRVWNTQTGELIRAIKPGRSFGIGENISYRIQVLPDDKHYVTVGPHGKPELRGLEDGSLIRSFE